MNEKQLFVFDCVMSLEHLHQLYARNWLGIPVWRITVAVLATLAINWHAILSIRKLPRKSTSSLSSQTFSHIFFHHKDLSFSCATFYNFVLKYLLLFYLWFYDFFFSSVPWAMFKWRKRLVKEKRDFWEDDQ